MALDLFGIVSNGVYPEDRDGDDDWFGYAVSMGLFTGFPAATAATSAMVRNMIRNLVHNLVQNAMR